MTNSSEIKVKEMADTPVSFKKKKAETTNKRRRCIIHYSSVKNDCDVQQLTDVSWHKISSVVSLSGQVSLSSNQASICDNVPAIPNFSEHGFHRECYKRFTNVQKVAKKHKITQETDSNEVKKRKRHPTGEIVLFPSDECIICGKNKKWTGRKGLQKLEPLIKCVTKDAEASLQNTAQVLQDHVYKKICGEDIVAREAHYHSSCRKSYILQSRRPRHENTESQQEKENQQEMEEAHADAFNQVVKFIEKEVILNLTIVRMSYLKQIYLNHLYEKFPKFYNLDYKTDKLKSKIIKKFQSKVHFCETSRTSSEIIYTDDIPTSKAVSFAYEASSEKRVIDNAASILRQHILAYEKVNNKSNWPPSKNELKDFVPPELLSRFINKLTMSSTECSSSTKSKASAIAQDICYVCSNGTWQLPKHTFLGISIHHITGSAQVITLLNRLGHSISYSKVLELETEIANQILLSETVLPTSAFKNNNKITHFCWDNFDLNEETVTGAGTTHSTHGISIQEHDGTNIRMQDEERITPVKPKVKKRSLTYIKQVLAPSIVKKQEPKFQITPSLNETCKNKTTFNHSTISEFVWLLSRITLCTQVPNWNGWLALTSKKDFVNHPSVVEYLRPIHNSATENSTIQELLKLSQRASRELDQEVTVITLDLATAKKGYAHLWNNPSSYEDVFLRLGTFHIICAYFNAIGKLLVGSGFEEIVLESGLCVHGSLNGIMTGKQYNRALRTHSIMMEALQRLLWDNFAKKKCASSKVTKFMHSVKDIKLSPEILNDVLESSEDLQTLLADFENEKKAYRNGASGYTSQFWVQYIDRVWVVLRLLTALKENDFCLYKESLRAMIPTFFAMDHHNYARYLSVYVISLDQLEASHPKAAEEIKNCALSVRRNSSLACGTAVDQTIEQSINKFAKSKAGIIGISQNKGAYDRWCLTRHERASYTAELFESVGISNTNNTKKDLLQREIEKSNARISKTTEVIKTYLNPFETITNDLICLSSGTSLPADVAKGLVSIENNGACEFEKFVDDRFITKSVSFNDPIKKKHTKTFESCTKKIVKRKNGQDKKVVSQRNICTQILMLANDREIDFEKLFCYQLGPFPWTFATSSGMLAKTNKAALLHQLEQIIKEDSTAVSDFPDYHSTYIVDGNVMFHSLGNLPETFCQVALQIFKGLPNSAVVHFITDTYQEYSIKSSERLRRGSSEELKVFGPASKVPRNFQHFLNNDENKKRLIQLIEQEWSSDKYASLLKDKQVYFVNEASCLLLKSDDGETTDSISTPVLNSSQEEADTRILLHCKFAESAGDKVLVVRTVDTDVFLLLLHFIPQLGSCQQILFDTGSGDKRRIIDLKCLAANISQPILSSLLGLHAFTGCDSTSAFTRLGKIKPLKIIQDNEEFCVGLQELGNTTDLSDSTKNILEKFVCYMYGSKTVSDVNKLRFLRAKEKFKVKSGRSISPEINTDLSLLPPCRDSLDLHIKRVNYQVLIWKNALQQFPEIPSADANGWKFISGELLVDWGDIMFPKDIEDILEGTNSDDEATGDEEDVEFDMIECSDSEEEI